MKPALWVLALILTLIGIVTPAQAEYRHRVLLDTDNNENTGCSIAVNEAGYTGGPVSGVEHQVTMHVDNSQTPPVVTQITHSSCA